MELLLPLLLLVTTCAARPQDLSGKMFTFPQVTNTAHVKLTTSRRDFSRFTVCHRSFTDLQRDHSLFSMATPGCYNAIMIYWTSKSKELGPSINNKDLTYQGLDYKVNKWHSVCTTWDSTSGLAQLWFDGQPLSRKYLDAGSRVSGSPTIVLGQEQDRLGGGFDINQSFVGMMTDVHMWNYVLSPCEIQKYMDECSFTPGNVLNWRALEFQIVGRVLTEDKQTKCV